MKYYVKLMIWIVSFKYNVAFGLSRFGKIAQSQWNDPFKLKDVLHRGMIDNWREKLVLVKRKKNYQSNS